MTKNEKTPKSKKKIENDKTTKNNQTRLDWTKSYQKLLNQINQKDQPDQILPKLNGKNQQPFTLKD